MSDETKQALNRMIDTFERRAEGQIEYLKAECPDALSEHKHLEKGATEHAYWHLGYAMALRDAVRMLRGAGEATARAIVN